MFSHSIHCGSMMQVTTILCWACLICPALAGICPHEDPKLVKFSDLFSSYDSTTDIVINFGTLLDVRYLEVNSIVVKGQGQLVFNQGQSTAIWTYSISVEQQGKMIIGSEICRHIDDVEINLKGSRTADRTLLTEDGEKYITVHDEGMLHIYGQLKTSWTKLNRTVNPMKPLYRHQTSDKVKHRRWMEGLVVYIFDGSANRKLFDGFDLWKDDPVKEENTLKWMIKAIEGAEAGDILSVMVNNYFITHELTNVEPLYELLEDIAGMYRGELLLRNVSIYDAFSIVFVKGGNNYHQLFEPSNGKEFSEAMAAIDVNGYKITAICKLQNGGKFWSKVDLWITQGSDSHPEVLLLDDVSSWNVGDEVLLTSTDYSWKHAEVRRIREFTGPKSFTLSDELEYRHFGEIEHHVDMRGEVALLTRNIKIRGVMSSECPPENQNCHRFKYDTYGGHIKIHSFKSIIIDGAELSNMGQNTDKGFYPIHFHMCLNITFRPAIIQRNTIRNTYQRAVTVHGTFGTSQLHPGVQVSENVAFNVLGHCYFLEDGPEVATIFYRNLGASVKMIWNGFFETDNRPSTFWITNPQTVLIGNVAAGSEGFGIWYSFPDAPLGLSRGLVYRNREAAHTPLYTFDNNVVHSNTKGGMNFDNIVLNDHGKVGGCIRYSPVEDPHDINSKRVKVQITRLTAYKNLDINLWLRGGGFEVIQFSSAESKRGIQLARGGRQQQFISKSVFVGISERNRETDEYPDPTTPASMNHALGIVFYDGPIYIDSTYFAGFKSSENGTFAAGAMGFNPRNKFSSSVVSNVTDIRFGFEDGVDGNRVFDGNFNDALLGFGHFDGDEVATFRDGDGTVARCPNSNYTGPLQIVKPEKYILTDQCTYRENWQMAICKNDYGKIAIDVMDTFVLDHDKSGEMRRLRYNNTNDTAYEDSDGVHSHEYMVLLGSEEYYYQYQFKNEFPKQFRIRASGIEKGNSVLIGICLPEGTTREDISLYADTPDNIWLGDKSFQIVDTLDEVKTDRTMTRLYIEERFMYMRISSRKVRNEHWDAYDDNHCPGKFCPRVEILLKQQAVSYSPCFRPTIDELTTDIYLEHIAIDNCTLPKQAPEFDWGAGDTQVPKDGGWGAWSSWAECCYYGETHIQTYRHRECDNPTPYLTGQHCVGLNDEVMACPTPCPTNGRFSTWSRWSDCFCDGIAVGSAGVKTRTRDCEGTANGGKFCWGGMKQAAPCNGDC